MRLNYLILNYLVVSVLGTHSSTTQVPFDGTQRPCSILNNNPYSSVSLFCFAIRALMQRISRKAVDKVKVSALSTMCSFMLNHNR